MDMDRLQMRDRLLSLMRQMSKQYTEKEAQELSGLFVECVAQDLPQECTVKLGRAIEQQQVGPMLSLMGQAVQALKDTESEKPAAPSVNEEDHMVIVNGEDGEGEKQHNPDDEEGEKEAVANPSSSQAKRKSNNKEEERYFWVRGIKDKDGNLQLRPTKEKVEVMRETLAELSRNWENEDGKSWTQPLSDEPMRLITFQSNGRTCCLFRHVVLYMSIVYNVFVDWKHNLDRNRRRRLLLMAGEGDEKFEEAQTLRKELGVVSIHTDQDTTDIGLLDAYEHPATSVKNKDKKKVLLVEIEGSIPEQIRQSPAVRCNLNGESEVLSFKDYFKLLMKKLLPAQAAAKRDTLLDTPSKPEAVPVKVRKTKKKKSTSDQKAAKNALKLPMDILVIRNNNLGRMVKYCDGSLNPAMVEWFGNTALDLQDRRDEDLLAKMEVNRREHDGLFIVHTSCKKNDEDQCEHLENGRRMCRHDRCDILECKRCPLLMRNYWYLMNLADTIDFEKEKSEMPDQADNEGWYLKSRQQCAADIIKVHKYKTSTQVDTVLKRLQSLRHFLEWYIVNVYDLLGREAFNDSQPTLIGLFHSSQFHKLLTKWHQDIDFNGKMSRQTSRNKLKDVIDVMECNVEYFRSHCIDPHSDVATKLRNRFEVTTNALTAHLRKIGGPGAKVRMQTNAKLSSTDEGKAPPISRVFDAHNFLHTDLWDKLKHCRGKADAHILPQWILLLAFIKLLMGARPGMLSHMAVGKNLKTIGWICDDDTVDHQSPNKEKGGDGELDSYVKGYALKYKKEISKRVPEEHKSELRYYVVLLALSKSWYGYKNGHINARIVPFHREMSMELIVFAASILYVRKETSEDVATLAGKFLKHWQDNRYDTTEAYIWLHANGKIDFLKLVNDQLSGPIRVFYKTEDKDKYGSHAIHPRGTSDTAKVEKDFSNNVTNMLKEAMRTYYASLSPGDIEVDELTDGSLAVEHLELQALKYTSRGVRSATADYISRLFPFMPEDIKKMLVEQTLMHTLETHNEVYIKDIKYMRCVALRSWMERGAPQKEWDDVEKTTKYQMAIAGEDSVDFGTPPAVQDLCVLETEMTTEVGEATAAATASTPKKPKGQKRKEKASDQDDDVSQASPPTSQSKRRRSEKLEPVRCSLFKDVGFGEHRLVRVDCCTYKVGERKHPSATDPTGGYVWLVWDSCSSSSCKKRKDGIKLEDSTAEIYLDKLKFISNDGETEEQWAGERFSTPLLTE